MLSYNSALIRIKITWVSTCKRSFSKFCCPIGSTKTDWSAWWLKHSAGKKMGCLCHPQTIPLALRSQLELKSQIVPSHQAPASPLCGGSIQPFVWCGDEIRPQPNLEAPLAVIVYTVTNSHLNSLLQLFLFLHCIYLPPSCGTCVLD